MRKARYLYLLFFIVALLSYNDIYSQDVKVKIAPEQDKQVIDAKEKLKSNIVETSADVNENVQPKKDDEKIRISRTEYNSLPARKKELVDKNINDYIIED